MNIIGDYFLLYHGLKTENKNVYNIYYNKNNKDFLDVLALILCIKKENQEQFIILESFKKIVRTIISEDIECFDKLLQLQYSILESISQNKNIEDYKQFQNTFKFLVDNNILDKIDSEKIISLFNLEQFEIEIEDIEKVKNEKEPPIPKNENLSFEQSKLYLIEIINELISLYESDDFKDELTDIKKYMNSQKFSIGITGVMNAGKSTMLNALMGTEILGSSVVPETANLTIIKSGNPQAKVFYWNKEEWAKIEKSSEQIEAMELFVQETKKRFGNDLDNLIKDQSQSEIVDIKNLSNYTSAKQSEKKCNLIKYVELQSNLKILLDSIEIVDTPGLDDPVVQREEITKQYLSNCDLMLHLMNVSQSATLKDVEFIIDALLYQNISKLLIVITRSDTVSEEQLNEVIAYTKKSIKTQLIAQNKNFKLDFILNSIEFLPISGKMALLHRIGKEKEAIEAGFSIEDTGILEIENYLQETLFSPHSPKSSLIIMKSKKTIVKNIEKELKYFNYQFILLSKSKDELEKELEKFQNTKIDNDKKYIKIQDDLESYKKESKDYVVALEAFLHNEFINLKEILQQRVFSNVKYSYEKYKKKPSSNAIKITIETAIKDGIIDIIRDYRYKFIKKSQTIGEIFEQQYQDLGFVIGYENNNFDARGFFQDDFKKGFLNSSYKIITSKIISEVEKSKSSKLNLFNEQIYIHIKNEFELFENDTRAKIKDISENLLEIFFKEISQPIVIFKNKLLKDEKNLKKSIINFNNNEINKDKRLLTIKKTIKKLNNIKNGLKI